MSASYIMADARFAVPEGFHDRSVNVLEWAIEGGDKLSLIAQRDAVASTVSLDEYVTTQTKSYPIEFDAYRVETETAAERPLAEARQLSFRFKREREVLYTHQVFVLAAGQVLVFTVTAKAIHRGRVDELMARVMGSLELRERT